MIKEAITTLVDGRSLTTEEAASVMGEIMEDKVTPAQFGAFVTALRLKGETVDEIVGLAKTMRAKAIPVTVAGPVVDTCGTGGDGSATFNISTAAPGHTPGYMALAIFSGGEQLLCISDVALHPIHLEQPDWYAAVRSLPVSKSGLHRSEVRGVAVAAY